MCLSKVIEVYEEPLKGVQIGYKVFGKCYDDGFYSGIYYNISPFYEIGKEYVCDNKGKICSDTIEFYPAGFHIYENFKSAYLDCLYNTEVIVEVEYSDAVCFGKEFFGNVIVAKKIKLIKEISRWRMQAI